MSAEIPKEKAAKPEPANPHPDKGKGKTPPESLPSPTHPDAPPTGCYKYRADYRTREGREWGKLTVEILTLIVISVYTFIAYHQWGEMQRATDSAHDALVIGQRPWIGFEGTPSLRKDSERWFIDFRVKNFGLSPALHAVLSSGTQNVTSVEELKNTVEFFCGIGEKLTTGKEDGGGTPGEHGYALFPGRTAVQAVGVQDTMQNYVYLIGCATYLDQFGNHPVHHTRFCYHVKTPLTDGKLMIPCFAGWNAD